MTRIKSARSGADIGTVGVAGSGGTFTNNNVGVNINHNGTGTLQFDVVNGTFSTPGLIGAASPININMGGNTRNTMRGTIANNTITNNNSLTGPAMFIRTNGTDPAATPQNILTLKIDSNNISNIGNRGIDILTRDGNSAINATVINNTVQLTDPLSADAIRIDAGATATDSGTINLDVSGNNADTIAVQFGIRIRQRFLTTYRLENYAGAATDDAAVAAYLAGRNPASAGFSADHVATGSGGFLNIASVPEPPAPLMFGPTTGPTPVMPPSSDRTSVIRRDGAPVVQPPVVVDDDILFQSELDSLVSAAAARWVATGLSQKQETLLQGLVFTAGDLPGRHLGQASGGVVRLDSTAAGNAWFIDATPHDESEFAGAVALTRRKATAASGPTTRVDLLSAILHEMGHALGLPDTYDVADRDDVMFGYLTTGERRVPTAAVFERTKN